MSILKENPLSHMIQINVLSCKKIWRFEFCWALNQFEIFWLQDWKADKLGFYSYHTWTPLVSIGGNKNRLNI